jgi:Cytochrome oxidase complex assembly protein 1
VASSGTFVVPHPPPQGWLHRNRKWFYPTLVVACLMAVVGLVFLVVAGVSSAFRNSYPYKVAVQRAEASPEVADRIGHPLKFGWFTSGKITYNGPQGLAMFNIPVFGPKGRGTIEVVAKMRAHRWTFETLQVDVEGQDQPIPLLEPQPTTSQPAANST